MASSEITEQRAVIKFCVSLGKTPSETQNMLKEANVKPHACRALVYKWHKRFKDGRMSLEDDSGRGRQPLISQTLVASVMSKMKMDVFLVMYSSP